MKSLKKIVITGPESSGKTTLAQALATQFQTEWVPEFAREYLNKIKGEYDENDLVKIAKGQLQSENKIAKTAQNNLLLCDTDLMTIEIWSIYKYNHCNEFITQKVKTRHYNLYLLCAPDIPWTPDPLREHPTQRLQIFNIYQARLEALNKPYQIITGTPQNRLSQAIKTIQAINQIGY